MITENILPKFKYRPDIDGLRAIAVLLVVFFHAFPKTLRAGFIGVDIFFVISGFLITTIIYEEISEKKFSYIDFYARRIRRIFPSLCLVLLSCLIAGWFVFLTIEYTQLGLHVAAGATFTSNILLWSESGYFDIDSATKPLLHLWSLGIEEQFYLVWPFIISLIFTIKKNRLILIILVIAFFSFILNILFLNKYPVANFYLPFSRFWELISGSILASLMYFYKHQIDNLNFKLKNLSSLLGLGLLMAGLVIIDDKLPFPGFWALIPVLSTAFFIFSGSDSYINKKVLSNPMLVSIGLISYPLYLWHWPIFTFKRIIEGGNIGSIKFRFFAIALSILLAWLSYRLIEKPFRQISPLRKSAGLLLICISIIGITGFVIYKNNGFDHRFKITPSSAITLYRTYPHEPFHNKNCDKRFPAFKDFNACLLSKDMPPEIILVGDSHSNQYYKSLSLIYKDVPVMNLAQWSCLPFSSISHQALENCTEKRLATEKLIIESDSINTVILAGYFSYLASSPFAQNNDGAPRNPNKPTKIELDSFKNSAMDFIGKISQSNKRVILFLDIPNLNFYPRDCVESKNSTIQFIRKNSFNKHTLAECKVSRVDYEKKNVPIKLLIDEIRKKFPAVQVFDPVPSLCDKDYCWALVNDIPIYYDQDHLTVEGASLVINNLEKYMGK